MSSSSSKSNRKKSGAKYTAVCRCGHKMRVRTKHFGRMCRCTQCDFPIYVTYDSVSPPVNPNDLDIPKTYDEHEVPINWKVGELITELYQVKEILGVGGMGTVYRLEHRGWGKMLAVKCPNSRLMNDPVWVKQFEHECETWINLSPHPNVVECYYMRRMGGLPRLFTEYVDGPDLDKMISDKALYAGDHREALKRILDIAIQFCWGLHHAHVEGLVHQDVKPSNLLIGEDGVVKVTDFGLAMVFMGEDGSRASRPSRGSRPSRPSKPSGGSGLDEGGRGSTGGTPTYRSNDHKVYDSMTLHADIWSWGVTMIEVFSGDVYWSDGHKAMSVLDNLLKHGSRYDVVPKIPEALQGLLRECFEEEREKRPEDMLVLVERLKGIYAAVIGEAYPRDEPTLDYMTLDILNNRAVSLLDLGQMEEAERLWEEVLTENPAHVEALYNRGLLYWRSGRITDTQMLELMQRLCEAFPKEWLPCFLMAQVCMERGDCTTAMELLEPLMKLEEYHRDVAYCQSMAWHFHLRDTRPVWPYTPEKLAVSAVGISSTGGRVVAGGRDGSIVVLNSATQMEVARYIGHQGGINSVCFARNEAILVSASADSTARVWHASEEKCQHVLKGHEGEVRKAVASNDGALIVTVGDDRHVMVWDSISGECVWVQQVHTAPVMDACVSICDRFVFTAGLDGMVLQWELKTGKGVRCFSDQSAVCKGVEVDRELGVLYVACGRRVLLWDIATGELRGTILAHQQDIDSLVLSMDGVHGMTATIKGTIKIWNLQTGQCIRSLHGYAPLAISGDGEKGISGGGHGDFHQWHLELDTQGFEASPMICR